MGLLQSSAPSLTTPLAVFGICLAAGWLVGYFSNAVLYRMPNPVPKYRFYYVFVLLPMFAVVYTALSGLGFGGAIVGRLVTVGDGYLLTVATAYIEAVSAGLVAVAGYTPTIPGLRSVRNIDITTTTAVRRSVRWVLAVSLPLSLLMPLLTQGPSAAVGIASVLLFMTAVAVARPWLVGLLGPVRKPTDATADRIETLAADVGLDVRDIRIRETDEADRATAQVGGTPVYRRLFLGESFTGAYDDETSAALLAVEAGKVRARYRFRYLGTLTGALMVAVVGLTFDSLPLLLLVLVLMAVVAVVGFWVARRGVYAADGYAARQVGAGTVAAAIEARLAYHGEDATDQRIPNPLSPSPSPKERIERLRATE